MSRAKILLSLLLLGFFVPAGSLSADETGGPSAEVKPRGEDGDGRVALSGELSQWHKVTLTLAGPFAHESDRSPNPFTDYRFDVTFVHDSGVNATVPGYFAADGDAAETSAEAGNQWGPFRAGSDGAMDLYRVLPRG